MAGGALAGPGPAHVAAVGTHDAQPGLPAVAEGDVDQAHGLGGRGAAGARDAGDAHAPGAAVAGAGLFGHAAGHFGADGPHAGQQLFGNAQQPGLGFVGIGHDPLMEDRRGTGHVGDALGQQAARAGFGRGQGLAALQQRGHDDAFQIFHVHAVDVFAQTTADGIPHGGHQLCGLFGGGGLGRDAHEHLAVGGVGGHCGVGGTGHVAQPQLGIPFAQGKGAHHAGVDAGPGLSGKPGHDPVMQHGQEFGRRAGQQDDQLAAFRRCGAARGRAHTVGKGVAAARQPGLLVLVLAHGPVTEVFPQPAQAVRIFFQRQAQDAGHGLLGEIVVGGAQAAGGDDQVAALQGGAQAFFQAGGVVAHHAGMVQVDAQGGEGAGHMGGVRIDGVAEQKLGAHGNDLGFHAMFLVCGDASGRAQAVKTPVSQRRKKSCPAAAARLPRSRAS